MTELGAIVTGIVSAAGNVITNLFTAGETPDVLTAVAVLPIVGGVFATSSQGRLKPPPPGAANKYPALWRKIV